MAETRIIPVPNITDEQKILVGVEPRTEGTTANPDGKPATIDGNVQWEVLEGNVTLEPVEGANLDGQRNIVGAEPNVTYRVRAWADADVTPEGVQVIDVIFAGTVTAAGAAELGGITVGEPVQQ